jgi:23S rRNA pseudouridine2605 synthase
MGGERLQKLLARHGIASRRRAEELVAAGRVRVNGRVAKVGERADPQRDRIEVDGEPLGALQPAVHYAVHKPRGFLSSARDERGRRSVTSLVPSDQRLWPAGRLDADSEGLMLLTNDGEWANRVLHPRFGTVREYAALVDPAPAEATVRRLRAGIELDDGPARLLSARRHAPPPEVERQADEVGTWLRVRIGEGRKREVRRLFEAVGHRVERLVRTRIGPLTLDGLPPGAYRELNSDEVAALAGERATRRRHRSISVAIDGPSGAGKSTVGHALAQRIGGNFVDTGLMYRALTLAALERGVDPEDGEALGRLAAEVRIEVRRPSAEQVDRLETVLLDGRDVTHAARSPEVDRAVSAVSRHAQVRDAMLAVQRDAATVGDTVMVGRDITTVVLPDATLKVYLTATAEVRAGRRAAEMGAPERTDAYLAEILRRDALDSGRELAPLRVAEGALVLDTGELSVEACVDAIVGALARLRDGEGA